MTTMLRRMLVADLLLSIVLGGVMEGLTILLTAPQDAAAGLALNAVRSIVICGGLLLASAALGRRIQAMGVGGLAAGPLGFYAGRFAHDATARLLDLPQATLAGGLEPTTIALIKGLEYGCLGVIIGWLGYHGLSRLPAYVLAGFAVGLAFGGVILALTLNSGSAQANLVVWSVNELVFPVGCAVVIRLSERFARAAMRNIKPY
jgi:hypothetical protein